MQLIVNTDVTAPAYYLAHYQCLRDTAGGRGA